MWHKTLTGILLLSLFACGEKGPKYKVYQKPDKIAYIIDEKLVNFSSYLVRALNDTFYTPWPDPVFEMDGFTPYQYQPSEGYPAVIILSSPQLASYVFFKLAFKNVKGTGLFVKKNGLAQGDMVIGVLAPGPELITTFFKQYQDSIKKLLLENYKQRLKKLAYLGGLSPWMPKELKKKYGIELKVPLGWTFIKLKDTIMEFDNLFGIVMHMPERFMFFYFGQSLPYITPEYMMNLRDSIAALYYGGDRIVRKTVKIDTMLFQGKYNALVLTGAWENDKDVSGGGFRSIGFNGPYGFVMIDMGVFAPDRLRKFQYILRMQLIAETLKFLSK